MADTTYTNPNTALQTQGMNLDQAPSPQIASTPFSPAQQVATQQQNGMAANAQQAGSYIPTAGAAISPQTINSNVQNNTTMAFGGMNTNQGENMSLADKYNLAHQNAIASGQPPPSSVGGGSAGVQDNLPQTSQEQQQQEAAQQQMSMVQSKLDADPGYTQLLKDQQEYVSSQNQQQSLVQQYEDLSKSLGLESINSQLVDAQKVINGTTDDIRSEIQAAGGFGTESQVQALALARNKSLVQNYNSLLATRDNINSQLSTIMGLSQQDKQSAQALAQEKINFDQQMVQYQQKFTQNAVDGYNNIIKSVGYSGLFHALQPGDIAVVEKTLGLPPGGLEGLAQQEIQTNQASTNKDALQNELLQAQIANTKATTANTQENTLKTKADIASTNASAMTSIQTATGTQNVPTILSPYVQTAYNGTAYADLSSLSPTDKAKMAQVASQAGIKPILTAGDAGKLNAISVSKTNLQNIQDSLSGLLNDSQSPATQGISNSIKSFLGNADVKSFNAWRTAVINNVQALAGGVGSGLKINQAEIDAALKNDMPVLTGTNADNLSTAISKIGKLNSQMDVWTKQLLGGGNTASGNQAGYIPPIGTVIQSNGKSYHVIDAQGNLQPI